jgi:hypothetical protein
MTRTKSALIGVTAIVAMVWGLAWYNTPERQNTRFCEEKVRSELKTPATAVFSKEVFTPMGKGGSDLDWDVDGEVDSQNSYGALVRHHFACVERLTEEDDWFHVLWDDGGYPLVREARRTRELLEKLTALKAEIDKTENLHKDIETGKVVVPGTEFVTPKMAKAIALEQLDTKLHELGAK